MWLSLIRLIHALNREKKAATAMVLPVLEYPLEPQPRVVVLGADVRPDASTLCLPHWTPAQLTESRPAALAGSWQELSAAGHLLESGSLDLPELSFPLVVFSNPARGILSDRQHELLWGWFHLPVFEQLRDADFTLLAWECEAREGFHVVEGADLAALNPQLLDEACQCGLPGARIQPAYTADRSRAAGR